MIALASVPIAPFPASLIFHSRPGAPNVLFIEFSGMTVTNSAWTNEVGRVSIPAMPFSTDADYATFSAAEQVAIKRIWQRMAEDYAPFNMDVTTERPATLNNRTAIALITRNTDANGQPNPYDTAGGVAYVNVFNTGSFDYYRPGWIYQNNLANDESYIAEAASHEIGHNLGLSHDGRTNGEEYYQGHGSDDTSWGPLMGTGYNRNVSQWSKGEYYLANNTQDDLATIAGKIAYCTDDHGNTSGTATAIVLTDGTNILSTTPENDPANTSPANKGVLSTTDDVDVFSVVTGSGAVRLAVDPWIQPASYRGGNLDVRLELYNAAGVRVATNNPATQTTALIQTNLAAGIYYLHVRNSGAGSPQSSTPAGYTVYGSIGQYFISGFITDPGGLVIPPGVIYSANMNTNPGWTLEPDWEYGVPTEISGPSSGYTGANIIGYNLSGNYPSDLPFKYATTPAINAAGTTSLTLKFRRWLGLRGGDTATIEASTNGTTWAEVWSSSSSINDSSWQEFQYALPAEMAGSPAVRIRWGLASDNSRNRTGWNLDDVEILAVGAIDVTPPGALLNVAALTTEGSPSHSCSVTYTDATAVKLASLSSSNLRVTGPNGFSNLVAFVGADLPLDGSPLTGSYSIPAPGGIWDVTDNGTYTITLLAGQVSDTLNNAVPETVLGGFSVAIPANTPGVLVVTPGNSLSSTGYVGGPFLPDALVYALTNSGGSPLNWSASVNAAWLDLSATNGTLAVGAGTTVTVSLNAATTALAASNFTATVSFLNTSSGNGNSQRGVDLTVVPVPVVSLNLSAIPAAWGSVSPVNGSYPLGTNLQLIATAAPYYQFTGWSGDVSSASNPLGVVLTSNLTAQAGFAEIRTTNFPTPHAWLAANGYTNDFESAVLAVGANGYPVWQSYVAGLDPNNPASQLLLAVSPAGDGTHLVFAWNTVTGRVYSVWSSANLPLGFTPLAGLTNLPWTVTAATNAMDASGTGQFFRLEVQKP